MEIGGYNIAWWMSTTVPCTLYSVFLTTAIMLHAIPITIVVCKLIAYLFIYAIQEVLYWLVSNTFEKMCHALPHQGPKRKYNL